MRRLIIISDSHGRTKSFEKICASHPEAERFVFLGDGAGDYEYIHSSHPDWAMIGVQGNCDYMSVLPDLQEMVLDNWRILMVHGHKHAVKSTDHYLLKEAKERGCNAVLFGHTHVQQCYKKDGIWLLNPGAVMDYRGPQYAVLDLGGENIFIANLTVYKMKL